MLEPFPADNRDDGATPDTLDPSAPTPSSPRPFGPTSLSTGDAPADLQSRGGEEIVVLEPFPDETLTSATPDTVASTQDLGTNAEADNPPQNAGEEVDDCLRPLVGPCGCPSGACAAHRAWWEFTSNRHSATTASRPIPAAAWRYLDELDLEATLRVRANNTRTTAFSSVRPPSSRNTRTNERTTKTGFWRRSGNSTTLKSRGSCSPNPRRLAPRTPFGPRRRRSWLHSRSVTTTGSGRLFANY